MSEPVQFQTIGALQDFLWHPHAHENFPQDCPLLIVELAAASLEPAGLGELADDLVQQLRVVPAVTVAAVSGQLPAGSPNSSGQPSPAAPPANPADLLAAFDIVLSPTPQAGTNAVVVDDLPAALADLTTTAQASPQAASSLVQLLRASETSSLRDALLVESWVYSNLQNGAEFNRWLQTSSAKPVKASITQSIPVVESTAPVLVEEHGAELHLVLNRPERRNAFNAAMRDALVEALRAARMSPPPGGIVISGAGKAFCSGGDLDEFGTSPDSVSAHVVRSVRSTAWELHLLREHITCQLHGACAGAGIELPAFVDRVVASEDAFFWLPEVRLGLVPGAGGTASIPRRIGRQRTCWMALSNRRIDPSTALEWGLIDAIDAG